MTYYSVAKLVIQRDVFNQSLQLFVRAYPSKLADTRRILSEAFSRSPQTGCRMSSPISEELEDSRNIPRKRLFELVPRFT